MMGTVKSTGASMNERCNLARSRLTAEVGPVRREAIAGLRKPHEGELHCLGGLCIWSHGSQIHEVACYSQLIVGLALCSRWVAQECQSALQHGWNYKIPRAWNPGARHRAHTRRWGYSCRRSPCQENVYLQPGLMILQAKI